MDVGKASLHGDALSQITRHIHIASLLDGYVICKQLQRYRCHYRGELFYDLGHLYCVVGDCSDCLVATGDYGYHFTSTCFYLLDVADDLFVEVVTGAMTTVGSSRSIRAMGPCFISAAGYPSACIYDISFSFKAPSRAVG